MSPVRRVARPLLASVFFASGVDQLRHPAKKVAVVENVVGQVSQLPYVGDTDAATLVRVNGGVQLGAATLLALGRLPRTSALALAVSLVPTTLTEHRYWEAEDPAQRQRDQSHFLKNVSLVGGLIIAALDTQGQPGLGWRARNTAERARRAVRRTGREARMAAKAAKAGRATRLRGRLSR
jgi:putative oxidoreductase